jgi:hypothetical protein
MSQAVFPALTVFRLTRPAKILAAIAAVLLLYVVLRIFASPPPVAADSARADTLCFAARIGLPCRS